MTALYFHPEAYSTAGPKLMGRNSAGESFLRGFLSYSTNSEFWVQVQHPQHVQVFSDTCKLAGRTEPVNSVDRSCLAQLAKPGVVYHPGPVLGEHAWQRASYGHGVWSLCGITHTTSSARAMDAIAELITAPVQPWDAMICTSSPVRNNVERVLQAQADYLQQRLGIQKVVVPQLPVIPLGIHTRDFKFSDEKRNVARLRLAVDEQTVVVLYVGRLSFHAKAHPLLMYQALERVAATLPPEKKIVLVECGWHANEFIAKAFADAAAVACPRVRLVSLDGRTAADRLTAWACADLFCSFSDNIQETFGISPIEAMAAGLPVVVSDWDGYKDTVRDGIDGFRIPTIMPGAGFGGDFALRHAVEIDTYDQYCGHTCSLIAVDVDAATDAFSKLISSGDLRRQMGAAGRQRAVEVYDWAKIIPRYEELWRELGSLRQKQAGSLKKLAHPWPARMDPFHAFASYPTQILSPDTVLCLDVSNIKEIVDRLHELRNLAMINFTKLAMPTDEECFVIIENLAQGPQTADALVKTFSRERQAFVFRGLAWLVKLGIAKRVQW